MIEVNSINGQRQYSLGIVEGFYGRGWSWRDRSDYARLMPEMGLNSYLYAPKSDPYLRKLWRKHWPEDEWKSLQKFSSECRSNEIWWGLGLSPFELYRNYDNSSKIQLREKISRINELKPDLIAVLFDDMHGEQIDLANRQYQIVNDICEQSDASRILVCPTYYSYDLALEKFFGQMPKDYWKDLGDLMPKEVELLWTGNQVCSNSISANDLKGIAEKFQRLPTLWDNYPVNDGRKGCNYINLKPLSARDLQLGKDIQGHFCNPMNQPNLSRMPLASLATLHNDGSPSISSYMQTLLDYAGISVAAQLAEDMSVFQEQGLDGISDKQLTHYKNVYGQNQSASAKEVVQWLNGEFTFDPECLTG